MTAARPLHVAAGGVGGAVHVRDALAMVAHGVPLTEAEARVDLCESGLGPKPDEWWAARWGWTAQDVHELRTTSWRARKPLPHPRPSKDPNWRAPRPRRST